MKILHITRDYNIGGAGRAVKRVVDSLNDNTHTRNDVLSLNYNTSTINIRNVRKLVNVDAFTSTKILKTCGDTFLSTTLFKKPTLVKQINHADYDLVHLHWISRGFLKLDDIAKIRKPIFWTLHDFWAFEAPFHYVNIDTLEENNIRKSILWSLIPGSTGKDLRDMRFHVTSKCTQNYVRKHYGVECHYSPLPLNISEWSQRHNRKMNKKKSINIGFISGSGLHDKRKGGNILFSAIKRLPPEHKEKIKLSVVAPGDISELSLGVDIHHTSRIDDDKALLNFYNGLDYLAVPSLSETFGQVALEAFSQGVPVIGNTNTAIAEICYHFMEQDQILCEPNIASWYGVLSDLIMRKSGIHTLDNLDEKLNFYSEKNVAICLNKLYSELV